MAFPVLGQPLPQFVDSNGDPLNGGTLEIRDPISNANKSTYPTAADADAATNANSADISLNIRGEPEQQIWGVDDEEYKVTLKDSSGVTIWTATDIAWDLPVVYSSSIRITRTSAETSAGIAEYAAGNAVGDIVNPEYEPGDIRRYGADTGAADNTAAIQAAVNQCSHGGPNVYVPVGRFVHVSPIYYYYDASNNPGFMPYVSGSTDYLQGHIHVVGERPVTIGAFNNGATTKGSQLYYDTSTGNAHLVGNDTAARHRGYQFHNLTLAGSTSGVIAHFNGSSHKCGLFNCTLFQNGTGGGVYFQSCWEIAVESTYCRAENASNVGYGIQILDPVATSTLIGAGNFNLIRSNFKGFKYGGEIGKYGLTAGGDYYTLQTVYLQTCEFGGTNNYKSTDGLLLGQHTQSLIIDSVYIENCTGSLLKADSQHQTMMIRGGNFAATYCTANAIIFGNSSAPSSYQNRQQCTIITGAVMRNLPENLSFIERNVDTDTGSLVIEGCQSSPASATGTTFLEINGTGSGVVLDGNDLYGSPAYANEYTTTSGEIDYYRSGNRQDGTRGDVRFNGVGCNTVASTTSGGDLDMSYSFHKINSSSGGFTLEVQDGYYPGHEITFVCNTFGSNVDIDFATDSTKDTGFGATGQRINSVDDFLKVVWDGGKWRIVANNGTVGY